MEAISCYRKKSEVDESAKLLREKGFLPEIVFHDDYGLYSLALDHVGPAPESVKEHREIAFRCGAVKCPQCESPEVQFPASVGEKWILPNIVDSLFSTTGISETKYFCRQCSYNWIAEKINKP